jgi:hypothetical protein
MKSYTTRRNLYGTLTQDTSSANLTLGDQLLNDSDRTICTMRGGSWPFLEVTKTVATVASQQGYYISNSIRKLTDVYVTVGTTIYMPEIIYDAHKWKLILAYQLGESDVPRFVYKQDDQLFVAPIPATSSNTITLRGRLNVRDLNTADYTTGTITSLTNGAKAVVGSGTTWTADMVGRFLRITETSAAGGGDGFWYEIGAFTDATHITLLKPYEGTTLAAATAAYAIGQMSVIPESYDVAPVYRAAAIYWSAKKDSAQANVFWKLYDGGKEAGLLPANAPPGGLIGQMLEEASDTEEGPYIPPFASTSNIIDPNYPQPAASGF